MPDSTLLELGPANVYLYEKPKASFATNLGGSNEDLVYTAIKGGAAGNSITIAYVVAGNNTPLSVVVSGVAITVNVATSGGGAATSTGDQVKDAVNAHIAARALVTAARKTGNDGSGVVAALTATPLIGGSDTGVAVNVGYLGEALAVSIGTEAVPLTAAQLGTIPVDKVVTGGSFRFSVPFKEISLTNFTRAIPNTVLVPGAGGLQRLEFRNVVGQKLRTLAVKVEIRKIVSGAESALPKDILVIPEASPVDGEVTLPFSPTDQRVVVGNFEAWPSDTTGRWAFFGDEVL